MPRRQSIHLSSAFPPVRVLFGIYKILVAKYKSGDISFENVVTFNMVCIHISIAVPLLIFCV